MKLTDLNPHFVGYGGDGVSDKDGNAVPRREGVGLGFDCPKCGEKHPGFVAFANPMDGGPPIAVVSQQWYRIGDTFDIMTLTPSILRRDCGWHGFITDGEIIEA